MKCHICDRQLSETEIQYNTDHGDFDPCGVCLEVIQSCFEPADEEEITEQLDEELWYNTEDDDVPSLHSDP